MYSVTGLADNDLFISLESELKSVWTGKWQVVEYVTTGETHDHTRSLRPEDKTKQFTPRGNLSTINSVSNITKNNVK